MGLCALEPLGLWCDSDKYQQRLRYAGLIELQQTWITSLEKEGYVHIRQALCDDELVSIHGALDRWIEKQGVRLDTHRREDGTFPRLIGLDQEIPEIAQLFDHPVMVSLQDLLLGHRCTLRTSMTFLQGSQQTLHRDIPIFHTTQEHCFFRVWIALEDTHARNGPLIGVRGGHRVATEKQRQCYRFYPTQDAVPEPNPRLWQEYQGALEAAYIASGLSVEPFELSSGDVVVWHPLFPHGGAPISDRTLSRRSIVLHFSATPLTAQG